MRWLPPVLVLCVLSGLAGIWWLWVLGGDPPPPIEPPAAGEPTIESEAVPVAFDMGGEAEEVAPAPAAEDTPAAEAARTDAVDPQDLVEGPQVLVVHGSPPVPVADAQVFHLTERAGQEHGRRDSTVVRFDWPLTWGQRTTTDANGLAQLPPTREPWLVAARAGGEFAFAVVRPGRRTVTMQLLLDENIEIVVLRANEQPAAAVPVTLLQHFKGEASAVWRSDTGTDGRTVARHFQLIRENPEPPAPQERFAALALVPTAAPVVQELQGRPATREPITLRLPPIGAVEVLVVDHRGTPLLTPAFVGATTVFRPETKSPFEYAWGLLGRREAKPVGDAPVRLAPVAAGMELQLHARFAGDRRGAARLVLPGPALDGDTVQAQLPLGEQHVVIAGRIVAADGAPIGAARLPASLWSAERDLMQMAVHTIGDGRFDIVLAGRNEAQKFWFEVRGNGAPLAAELGVRRELPHLRGGNRIDLGDLVLAELPALAGGVVVDDRGEPVRAGVTIQQKRPSTDPSQPESWENLPHLATMSADDGTFLLCGERPPGELRVRADTDQHFANTVPLLAAGTDLRIRIDRTGILRGQALLPDWIDDGTVTLTMRPFDAELRQRDTRSTGLRRRGSGRFVVEPLRLGRYDAIVTLRNVQDPLLVVPDVFVQPGEVTDGRLTQLDLRQSLYRYRLRAVDAAGQPLGINGPIVAKLQTRDGNFADAAFRWRGGAAELITASPLAELLFFGRGLQPSRLLIGPGDHDVFLQQLRPALLTLPGARAVCGPQRRIRVSVVLTDSTGYPEALGGIDQRTGERFSFARWDLGKSSGAWLEHIDTVEVPLMKSGKYEVILRVHATESERSPQASVSLGTFDLRVDSPSMVPITVPIDAGLVQQAIAGLEQRAAAPQNRSR